LGGKGGTTVPRPRTATMPTDIVEYDRRRQRLRGTFDVLPLGSFSKASFELRIHQSKVSNVINGVLIDETILTRLENWAREQRAPASKAS
jgi:hypothetical protein